MTSTRSKISLLYTQDAKYPYYIRLAQNQENVIEKYKRRKTPTRKKVTKSFKRDKSRVKQIKRKVRKLRKRLKKIQSNKPNRIFSVSTLLKIPIGKKAVLISALPTHRKLLTETASVSDVIIAEGTFLRVKVGHLNSLDMQYAVKEEKEKSLKLGSPVFEARVLQELQKAVNLFHLCLVFVIID